MFSFMEYAMCILKEAFPILGIHKNELKKKHDYLHSKIPCRIEVFKSIIAVAASISDSEKGKERQY